MIFRVKDFSSIAQVRDNASIFGDDGGDDFLSYGQVAKRLDAQKKQFDFIATTDDVDHHDERIAKNAFHEERGVYLRNPVLLANHMHRTANGLTTCAGFVMRLDTNKNPVTGLAQMVDTEVGRDHGAAIFAGAQRGISVGFRVRDTEIEDGRTVITRALLLEISVVSVPANPFALVLNYAHGKLAEVGNAMTDASRKHDWAQMLKELRDELRGEVESVRRRIDGDDTAGAGDDDDALGFDDDDDYAALSNKPRTNDRTKSETDAQAALDRLQRDLSGV